MQKVTRRTMLTSAGVAALATAIPPVTAAADPSSDAARILANATAIFAGTPESNSHPAVGAKLAAIDSNARTRLAALDGAGPGELFRGQPLGTSDPNLNRSYGYLYEIALATRIPTGSGQPNSDLRGNVDVQRRVIDGLVWLHDRYLGDQQLGYYGNWFNWEIAIPTHLTKTLALLQDQVAEYHPDLLATSVATMDLYLRNGRDGDVDLDSRFHTGANLADITTNRILQGALLDDAARIAKAVADQQTVFTTIDPYELKHGVTDGYYADGSFIQHHSVAYTGSYGKVLLTRVVQVIKILNGTDYSSGAELIDVVVGWVRNGFAPLIFEGWMMEIVKGRAVSRPGGGYADVAAVIEALVDLSEHTDEEDSVACKGYIKHLTGTSRTTLDPATFVSPRSVQRYSEIIADDSIPAKDLNAKSRSVAFNAMERNVHRRPGYAFALARSSERISKYEYMSGDNLMPWFQGDGAYYLYLAGLDQTQSFGVDYYTTVEPYRLAGVSSPTETRKTVPESYGLAYYDNPSHPLNFTPSSESQNAYVYFPRGTRKYSGGAAHEGYAIAGWIQSDDVAYRDKQAGVLPEDFVVYKNSEAVKSWFMLDDEIVVLAAGIRDTQDRDVITTVDSRIAAPADDVKITGKLRSGGSWSAERTSGEPSWLHYANTSQGGSVGYVFLSRVQVSVALEDVSRSRRLVRTANPDTPIDKTRFGLAVTHPAGSRTGSLAYALVPNADAKDLDDYAGGPISVLANSERIQAIRHESLNLTMVNVFADQANRSGPMIINPMVISGPASVILKRHRDGKVTVAVSDPTFAADSITITLLIGALVLKDADDGVTATPAGTNTRLTFTTHQLHGRTLTGTLVPRSDG